MASGSKSDCKEVGDSLCRKDKIDQWIKGGADLVSLIDKGDIRDVDDVKQYLDCSGDSSDIDKTNKFAGQTPLMIACRNRQTAIVNFLLEAGANPNLMCAKMGNSALHYACQGEGDVVLMCREKPNYPKEKLQEIIKIVELLANHGAVPGVNADGESPVCDLVSLIDQGDIIDVDDVKQYLDWSGDFADIDKTNNAGQTPLMIACRNRQTAIVNFLLEAGANPNLMCAKMGNSALHYACQGEGDVVLMCREKPNYPKEKLQEIIKIVELLANHGTVPGVNADGLSPVCVAALNSFRDVVKFFASSNVITTPIADKVKAYELLGVSQAVIDYKHHLIDACESFHLSSLHSKDDNDDTPHHVNSDLGAWFYDMMNKKILSESEEIQVKAKAVLIGLQCLPDKIKEYRDKGTFIDNLAECAQDALFNGREEGYSLLVALFNKEIRAEYTFNSVLKMLEVAAGFYPALSKKLLLIPKLLEVYAEAFRVGNCRPGRRECEITLEVLGGLLFNLAYFPSKSKYLKKSLPFVSCIVTCIRKMFDGESSQDGEHQALSVFKAFFENMAETMWRETYIWRSKRKRNRVEFAICRILYFNGFDPDSDKSVLQTLLDVIPVAQDMEFILSVSRVLIRYGCPTGGTRLEKDLDEVDDDVAELLELVSPPTTPISLEELASRTILCNAIPYRDRLPMVLCEKIEGDPLRLDPSELDSSSDSDSDRENELAD